MKSVIQRVIMASVWVNGELIEEIGKGLLVFTGIARDDSEKDISYTVEKITGLRIFPDDETESALSVRDIGGEILLISQFTLFGDVKKGKRPSFSEAMNADDAKVIFEKLYNTMADSGIPVKRGIFHAMMNIRLENDGPYTIILDSK